jgi:hypothetical protein
MSSVVRQLVYKLECKQGACQPGFDGAVPVGCEGAFAGRKAGRRPGIRPPRPRPEAQAGAQRPSLVICGRVS